MKMHDFVIMQYNCRLLWKKSLIVILYDTLYANNFYVAQGMKLNKYVQKLRKIDQVRKNDKRQHANTQFILTIRILQQ